MPDPIPDTAHELAPNLTPLMPVAAEVTVVHPFRERYWLHALLLLATIFTTLTVGAGMQFNFQNNFAPYSADDQAAPFFPLQWVLHHPARLLLGIPFSATLLLILLCHEMGHYLYCRRYRIWASLPYFIPFPSLAGTMGAFIRIRSAIYSRTALFDIGIAGPIAGFIPALAALFVGLSLSKPNPSFLVPPDIAFGHPFIFREAQHILAALTHAPLHLLPLDRVYLHPVAFAAWVGMVVTSLNLLPGGQLDGGHIIYAVFPRGHRWITLLTAGALIPMGLQSVGWWIWAVVLLAIGWRHPPVPAWPGLDNKRKLLALGMVFVLLAAITPVPVLGMGAADLFPGVFGRLHLRHN
jgi:membrane-associated protease RseP (regulator of RpoE activity)